MILLEEKSSTIQLGGGLLSKGLLSVKGGVGGGGGGGGDGGGVWWG